jgi:hypothetical protein
LTEQKVIFPRAARATPTPVVQIQKRENLSDTGLINIRVVSLHPSLKRYRKLGILGFETHFGAPFHVSS